MEAHLMSHIASVQKGKATCCSFWHSTGRAANIHVPQITETTCENEHILLKL